MIAGFMNGRVKSASPACHEILDSGLLLAYCGARAYLCDFVPVLIILQEFLLLLAVYILEMDVHLSDCGALQYRAYPADRVVELCVRC